jgi:hypothetical protein
MITSLTFYSIGDDRQVPRVLGGIPGRPGHVPSPEVTLLR